MPTARAPQRLCARISPPVPRSQFPGVGRGVPRLRYDLGGDFCRAGGAAFLSVERRLEFEHRFEEIVLNRAISERSALLVREICLRENELVLRNF